MADDNLNELFLLQQGFVDEPHSPEWESVHCGAAALARLRTLAGESRHELDLIVLDAHLPRLSAEEVLIELEANGIRLPIPVVIYSAFVSPEAKRRLMNLGAARVVQKPSSLAGYAEVVKELNEAVKSFLQKQPNDET